jgi:hypothetical protein
MQKQIGPGNRLYSLSAQVSWSEKRGCPGLITDNGKRKMKNK